MTAFGIAAADTGYTFPVIAAGEKVLAHRLDPFEAKLPECIGISSSYRLQKSVK